jgi:hypothetical protein
MDWVPIVFLTFKVLVFGAGMFFAIKWHYDQAEKKKDRDMHAVLVAGGKAVAAFALSLLCLGFFTFMVARLIGLNLTFP